MAALSLRVPVSAQSLASRGGSVVSEGNRIVFQSRSGALRATRRVAPRSWCARADGESTHRAVSGHSPVQLEEEAAASGVSPVDEKLPGIYYLNRGAEDVESRAPHARLGYMIQREEGNIVVDPPPFSEALARQLDSMGGVSQLIFLGWAWGVGNDKRWGARYPRAGLVQYGLPGSYRAAVAVNEFESHHPDLLFLRGPALSSVHNSMSMLFKPQRLLFAGNFLTTAVSGHERESSHADVAPPMAAMLPAPASTAAAEAFNLRSYVPLRAAWILPGVGEPIHLPSRKQHDEFWRAQLLAAWGGHTGGGAITYGILP